MPAIVHCPTCRHPLAVHESQSGLIVTCPMCRHPLSVPTLLPVVPSATQSEENPFATPKPDRKVTSKCHKRFKRTNGWIFAGIGFLVALLVVGTAVYWHWRERRAQQVVETSEFLLILNRQGSVLQEMSYWQDKGLLFDLPLNMEIESLALAQLSDERDKALNERYGYTRSGLGGLDKQKGEAFGVLSDATKDITKRQLESAHRSALAELARSSKSKSEIFQHWAKRAHTQIADEIQRLEQSFWRAR